MVAGRLQQTEQARGPILLVDDEPYILRSLSYLLTREGYAVETASNGEEGLERAAICRAASSGSGLVPYWIEVSFPWASSTSPSIGSPPNAPPAMPSASRSDAHSATRTSTDDPSGRKVFEFQRLRLSYARDWRNVPGERGHDTVGLQWTGVLGHHVHGFRDR